jgi:hypothetical protein
MTAYVWTRRIGTMISAVALNVAVEGCIGDVAAETLAKPDRTNQLRYYGGPKSPAWASPQTSPTSAQASSRNMTRACGSACPADK